MKSPPRRWWETFHSPQLDQLIEDALSGNQTLRSYWARVDRAQALARKAGSDLFPSVTGNADVTHTRFDDSVQNEIRELDRFSLGLGASYEVDLWGRIRAARKSADLSAIATREDLHSTAMIIAAGVAGRWVQIIANKRRLEILQQQLKTNQNYLQLVELRFVKSLASALDVLQQKQLVERVNAQIPLVEMEGKLLRDQLAVLTGRLPHELYAIDSMELPVMSELPAAGVPAALLVNRPDIRAAQLRLEAADQGLVVARADRLPALRLTGGLNYENDEIDSLFDNWLVNLAAGLTAPLIDGGRRRAEVEATSAQVEEQLALYKQTVLVAMQEVEDSLIREIKIGEHIGLTEKQLQAANNALSEARNRYLKGLNDYLPVLTQLLSVHNLEIDLINRQEDLFLARIDLYRSIGGTWVNDILTREKRGQEPQDKKS